MPENRYKRLRSKGVTFVFKYEQDPPDMLHIYARHLKNPNDAIYIFFNGNTSWNREKNRWETILGEEGLWWFWLNEADKVVMIISCFDEYSE